MIPEWLNENLPSVELISERLSKIFTRQQDPNGYILREIGAKTIFVMLYGFCVDSENWIRPSTVTYMSDNQSEKKDITIRERWLSICQSNKSPKNIAGRWYKENTREPIRDETIRELMRLGAVEKRKGLPTTTPLPTYTLQREFADLFNPTLSNEALKILIKSWQENNLTAAALARLAISEKIVKPKEKGNLVTLPNGETRILSHGPSTVLVKAVVEEFTKIYMKEPAVLLISESARKIDLKDDELCQAIGFHIDVSGVLPDLILADLGRKSPVIIFIECVASDGPINDRRKEELINLAKKASFREKDCAYVTVFRDRTDAVSRKLNPSIAWGTFIWYATEPNELVYLHEGTQKQITHLIDFLNIKSR